MSKKILLFHTLMIGSILQAQQYTIFSHGFNNHPGRFLERNLLYAPAESEPIKIAFQHKLVCFGVKGKNVIAETVGDRKHEPTSIVAFSQGTAATLHYLGNKDDYSNIQSIVLIAPLADPRNVVQNHSWLKYVFMPQWVAGKVLDYKFSHYNPVTDPPINQIDAITNLPKTCPIIIIHGTNDQTSPFEQGYRIAERFYEQGYPVYFIKHEGRHNQPYDPNLYTKMKAEIAALDNPTSEKIRTIKEKYCQPEREAIAEIVHAIYKKHDLPYHFNSNIDPEQYSFQAQKVDLKSVCKKHARKRYFLKSLGTLGVTSFFYLFFTFLVKKIF